MSIKTLTIKKTSDMLKKLKGLTIELVPGLNFIVGENGIGKSSLLHAIFQSKGELDYTTTDNKKLKTSFFDTEKMNPRIKNYYGNPFEISLRFISHGECIQSCLNFLDEDENLGDLIGIDEPESGLSPWSQQKLLKNFLEISETRQLIIATHSVIFAQASKGRLIELKKKKVTYFDPPKTYTWGKIFTTSK